MEVRLKYNTRADSKISLNRLSLLFYRIRKLKELVSLVLCFLLNCYNNFTFITYNNYTFITYRVMDTSSPE